MKIVDTFVTCADDSNAVMGRVPPMRDGAKEGERTIARLHYDLLTDHPYEFDLDSFNFEVYCLKNHIAPEHRDAHRAEFFSKGHPCMRASPLTKTYGFGAHYDGAGRIAIYPVDSKAYAKFVADAAIRKEPAMRSRRPSAETAGAHPGIGQEPIKPAA